MALRFDLERDKKFEMVFTHSNLSLMVITESLSFILGKNLLPFSGLGVYRDFSTTALLIL
jgi:hypothetical protein